MDHQTSSSNSSSVSNSSLNNDQKSSISCVDKSLNTMTLESSSKDSKPISDIVCLEDFEPLAKSKLDGPIFKFIYHGADEENTTKWNHQKIIDNYWLKPRILRDVSRVDLTKYIYGDKVCMPIGIAPTGLHKAIDPSGGELATVRAANKINALMIHSQFSTTSLEDLAKEAPICTKWQNVYILRNREQTHSIINRAIRYGYRALVVSCDSPVLGHRRNLLRKKIDLQDFELKNFCQEKRVGNGIKKHAEEVLDPSVTWQDLADLKKMVGDTIKLIVKGIMTPEDAEEAIKIGVNGIYISNHGGRQLDCCQSTIEALPSIVKVVNKRCPIFIDGGFLTGNDVLKALALGADMVFIGRPIVYSLAAFGEEGVYTALNLLKDELRRAMMLCGCSKLTDINEEIILTRNTC